MEQVIEMVDSNAKKDLENAIKGLVYIFNQENKTNIESKDLDIERIKEEIIDKIWDEISFNVL